MNPTEIELKKKHGHIFKIHAPESNVDVYFKLMSKTEYDSFNSLCKDNEITPEAEDFILQSVVVHPDISIINDLYAGEVSAIVQEAASRSGFYDLKTFSEELKARRAMTETLSEQILVFISKAFPTYTLEELEAKNYKEIARLLAAAELLLGQQLGVTGEEEAPKQESSMPNRPHIVSPEQEQAMADRARQRAEDLMHKYKHGMIGH